MKNWLPAVMAIMCLGIIVYSNTFNCSFHFDDFPLIVDNSFITSLQNFLAHWKFYPCRFLTVLSIVINYHFNGLNVFGYHLFNLTIHLACAILVWWLTLLTLSTPVLKKNKIAQHARLVALLTGLVFVSHPVQIEAVTYIWQRATSMAALFYLTSLCLYVKSRLLGSSQMQRVCYISALIAAVMGMFTKENTVTLPLMILLYEYSFFEPKKDFKYWGPFLLTILIIPLTILFIKSPQLQAIEKYEQASGSITPWQYLLTQSRVLVTYIRLIFIPVHQNIDYDFSISKSILEFPVFASFTFLAVIFGWGVRLFSKYRLIAFAIFWFFLTLSLESTLLPFKNVIFEHRLYLPLVGYCLFLVGGTYYLLGTKSPKTMVIVLGIIISFNAVLTYQRNRVWLNEFTLWNDAVDKSPRKARALNNRGLAYYNQGDFTCALADYNQAIEIQPTLADAYGGRALIEDHYSQFPQAIADYSKAIELKLRVAEANNNRSIYYLNQGYFSQTIAVLFYNRGVIYAQEGDVIQAIANYNKAIEIDPGYADAYYNRGLSFAQQKYFDEALFDFDKVIALNPNYTDAYNNRGIIYAMQGNFVQAMVEFTKALKIDPNDSKVKSNLVQARWEYSKAKSSSPQKLH